MPATDELKTEFPTLISTPVTRREDIEIKQGKIARLLADSNCEGLLILEPANFRWLTSGAAVRGLYHADESPALYVKSAQRWLLCGSIDTQRFFDEELDGLCFQVKEWPWQGKRESFLADLLVGRKIACDRTYTDCENVGIFLAQERRRLSQYERDRCWELGVLLAHVLDTTARNIEVGEREDAVAGQLAHRLLKCGMEPVSLQISADGRARTHRRPGYSSEPIDTMCAIQATACKFGLYATASRTVCFGPPSESVKQEFEIASRLHAYWLASLKVGDRTTTLYDIAKNLLNNTPFEHEWRLSPPGWLTGREASESLILPASPERFNEGQMAVWQARIGGAVVCDTYLLQENGWNRIAAVEEWPIRRYVIQGTRIDCPDFLIRSPS